MLEEKQSERIDKNEDRKTVQQVKFGDHPEDKKLDKGESENTIQQIKNDNQFDHHEDKKYGKNSEINQIQQLKNGDRQEHEIHNVESQNIIQQLKNKDDFDQEKNEIHNNAELQNTIQELKSDNQLDQQENKILESQNTIEELKNDNKTEHEKHDSNIKPQNAIQQLENNNQRDHHKNEENGKNSESMKQIQYLKNDDQHERQELENIESKNTIQQFKNEDQQENEIDNNIESQLKHNKQEFEKYDDIEQQNTIQKENDPLDHHEHKKYDIESQNTIQKSKNNQLDNHEHEEHNNDIESQDIIQQLTTDYHEHENLSSKFKPIKNLKFCGMRDPVHPKLFIENFEQFAAQENLDEDEKQNSFIGSLRKYAAIWLEEQGYGTYDEMKEAFLSFYWSSDIQDSFMKYLNTGKYTKKCRLSMANYFFKHAIGAKFLDSSPSEKEIIAKLLKHFDKHIGDEIIIQKAETIEEVIDILKRIDILKGNNKVTNLSKNVSSSIMSSDKKNSLNSWGWLFLLLAISTVGLSFFSKIYMTK